MIFRTIALYCYQSRLYWRIRRLVHTVIHWRRKRGYGIRQRVRDQGNFFTTLRNILRPAAKSLLWAVAVAISIQLLNPFFESMLGLSVPKDSDYVAFLGAVSGIGAVFIGLYYTGISAVGSAIYSRVPNNVRSLLAEERFGNVYMRFLSFLTVLSLTLISLRVLDFPRNSLAVPIVAILAGFGVVAFVQLGRLAFYFFDPTKLSASIFESLQRWLGMVRIGGFQWNQHAFQKNAHLKALTSLDTLQTLADITAKEPHLSGKPFIELTQNLVNFLRLYEHTKRRIPTNSLWYEEQYQQRDWYLSDYSDVATAHATGTFLKPTMTTNKEWVEDKAIPILQECILANLKSKKYADLMSLFDNLDQYCRDLSRNAEIQRAIEILSEVSRIVLDQTVVDDNEQFVLDEELEKIAIVERVAFLSISVILGFGESMKELEKQVIANRVKSINWVSPRSIYKQSFPTHCLEQLEWLRDRLAFEFNVEGRFVTPHWYQTELVCLTVTQKFAPNIHALINSGATLFSELIRKALNGKHVWQAAAIMSRAWEYWSRLSDQAREWEKHWHDLTSDRKLEGLPWPSLEFEAINVDIDKHAQQLIKLMSRQIEILESQPRPKGFPDYAGQFLHTAGEVALDAILNNNEDLLGSVFESYLIGCLSRFEHIRPMDSDIDWRVEQQMKVAIGVLLDVIDVSGYARLFADYHRKQSLWNLVTTTWDRYIEPADAKLPILTTAVRLSDSTFAISHRDVLRTSWNQRVINQLRDVPRHEKFDVDRVIPYTIVDHESALVRIFAGEHFHGTFDGVDIFIEFYLDKIRGDMDLNFGTRRRHLRDSLDREEQRGSRNSEDTESE